jgi:hypothetical protein
MPLFTKERVYSQIRQLHLLLAAGEVPALITFSNKKQVKSIAMLAKPPDLKHESKQRARANSRFNALKERANS